MPPKCTIQVRVLAGTPLPFPSLIHLQNHTTGIFAKLTSAKKYQ